MLRCLNLAHEGRLRRRPEGGAGSGVPGRRREPRFREARDRSAGRYVWPWAKSRRGFRWALPEDEALVAQPKIATWSAERRPPVAREARRRASQARRIA